MDTILSHTELKIEAVLSTSLINKSCKKKDKKDIRRTVLIGNDLQRREAVHRELSLKTSSKQAAQKRSPIMCLSVQNEQMLHCCGRR